ncbi:MAG TPA: peptidoglycan editing factor PgeF [Acidobacteriaceae bacterium]|nr:peptidoglycan editing factor PgeF [Acidobacteriaceae bacterium]
MPELSFKTAFRSGEVSSLAPIQVPGWDRLEWLWHGFSTRPGGVSRVYLADPEGDAGGDLNLGFTDLDDPEAVRENRRRFVAALTGADQKDENSNEVPLSLIRQVHSNRSVLVSATDGCLAQPGTVEADGLMSDEPGRLIGVLTADCIPVLVVDPEHRAVAAFHAGWRGTVERIVELGLERMREAFGTDPAQALAAIGPGIGPCCYTVGEEVRQRFGERFSYAEELFTKNEAGMRQNGMRLDLTEANRRQLMDAGLPAESIAVVGGCTSCQPKRFFSHRASGGRAGRMMAAIGRKR